MATVDYTRFRVRAYTLAEWTGPRGADPLLERELGVVLPDPTATGDDKRWQCKIGDGSTPFIDLEWAALGLGEVDLSSLVDGDVLVWNASANAWQPGPAGLSNAALFARISLRV